MAKTSSPSTPKADRVADGKFDRDAVLDTLANTGTGADKIAKLRSVDGDTLAEFRQNADGIVGPVTLDKLDQIVADR